MKKFIVVPYTSNFALLRDIKIILLHVCLFLSYDIFVLYIFIQKKCIVIMSKWKQSTEIGDKSDFCIHEQWTCIIYWFTQSLLLLENYSLRW